MMRNGVETRSRARWPRRLLATVAALAVVALAAYHFSPWPSVLAIRWAFERGGQQASDALAKHVPDGVSSVLDLSYDEGDARARFDLHRPAAPAPGALPLLVWIHGGGFVAGDKSEVANYSRVLAARGYVVAAIEYSLAPGARYPTPVRQANSAIAHLLQRAAEFGIDADRVVLAGDSAGAQIAAQVANLSASPEYAAALDIRPALSRAQLRGVVLFCGPYDLALVDRERPSWFLSTVLWSYSGRKDYWNVPGFDLFSVPAHVTPQYPPTFLSVGNADPLAPHSRRLAQALAEQRVPVDSLFFAVDHSPALGHEYQFDLDGRDGQEALRRVVAFLDRVLEAAP